MCLSKKLRNYFLERAVLVLRRSNRLAEDIIKVRSMIVSVGNSGAVGVDVGPWVGVGVAAIDVGVEVAVEVGVEMGVGVEFEVLTSTIPSVIIVVMGWIAPFFDGLLRVVPSIEI
jgi:hypothetical protein